MKATMLISAALFALVVLGAGCDDKKKDTGTTPGTTATAPVAAAVVTVRASCNNIKNLSTCTEYNEQAYALGEGFVKGACEATSGQYATAPCPSEKQLGICTIEGGQFKKYYADGSLAYKADAAGKDCRDLSNGKWALK